MLDIYAYAINSWVGSRPDPSPPRTRAAGLPDPRTPDLPRTECSTLAHPRSKWRHANGCSRESDHDREPRVPRVGVFILPVDQIADIWTADADSEHLALIFMKNRDKFTLNEDTTKALLEYLNEL